MLWVIWGDDEFCPSGGRTFSSPTHALYQPKTAYKYMLLIEDRECMMQLMNELMTRVM